MWTVQTAEFTEGEVIIRAEADNENRIRPARVLRLPGPAPEVLPLPGVDLTP